MSWLQPKLHLRVAQKQILTPGLVQMVSVLALNRLELREMINQEMIENPVLEELSGVRTAIEDLWAPLMANWGQQSLQPHQAEAIARAAQQIENLP